MAATCDAGQSAWVKTAMTRTEPSVWMVGRQRGKSWAFLAMACELCQRQPGAIVRYATLTGKSAKAIAVPTFGQLFAFCPPELKPSMSDSEGEVRFKNGSVITFAGTDNEQFERLRGPRAHLIGMDESAFFSELERIEGALLPQLTTTRGRVVYLSTPPLTPAHPFLARYAAARVSGTAVHDTIWGNPRLGKEGAMNVARFEASRLGMPVEEFMQSTYWRREYLAEVVAEETRAALPAWNADAQERFAVALERPQYFDGYTSLDFGWSPDPHGVLFGYHDPGRNALVIEDELEMHMRTVAQLCEAVKAKETALWGVERFNGTMLGARDVLRSELPAVWLQKAVKDEAPRQPYLRVGDNQELILAEMATSHGVAALPTKKDEKALAVDAVNQLIRDGRLFVHPRCKRLLVQMQTTLWDKRRREWERTSTDHGELIDCLTYMVRNVRWHRDCRPAVEVDRYTAHKPATVAGKAAERLSVLAGVFRPEEVTSKRE